MTDPQGGAVGRGSDTRFARTTDGRRLAFVEYGDASGVPCFYIHFTPGSRFEPKVIFAGRAELLAGIRLIAIDRPGYGASDFQPDRALLDWPGDAEAVDQLGIDRFVVLGASGGGGYALSCAHAIPTRVTVAVMVSGMGPFERPEARQGMARVTRYMYSLSRRVPWLARAIAGVMFRRLAKQLSDAPPPPTAPAKPAAPTWDFMSDPRLRGPALETLRAAVLDPGPRGVVQDLQMYTQPWPFEFEDIQVPVYFWHGAGDVNVPIALARFIARRIPNSEFHTVDGDHTAPIARIGDPLSVVRQQV